MGKVPLETVRAARERPISDKIPTFADRSREFYHYRAFASLVRDDIQDD
jgi:hypothetical protein